MQFLKEGALKKVIVMPWMIVYIADLIVETRNSMILKVVAIVIVILNAIIASVVRRMDVLVVNLIKN